MFESFATRFVDTGDASIFTRHGGDGPAVLLLHGHPRTSATWHRVAPLLVERGFTVVCPDLRGYGRSRGPAPAADHSAHCKRALAADMLQAMRVLGHDRFSVAGHDRGSCVALRLALDYPRAIATAALLDGILITEHLSRITLSFATHYWHWFFYAQPEIPSGSSPPTQTPGITAAPARWARRITTNGEPPSADPRSSAPCLRTIAPA